MARQWLAGDGFRGAPAQLELGAQPMRAVELPEDLLAVLGWCWTRLAPYGDAWRAEPRLRGLGLARGQVAETRLLAALQHLAATFAAPADRGLLGRDGELNRWRRIR